MIDRNTFMYGEIIVTAKGQPQFLPGIYNISTTEDFTPGVVLDMGKNNPSVFVEGKIFNRWFHEFFLCFVFILIGIVIWFHEFFILFF